MTGFSDIIIIVKDRIYYPVMTVRGLEKDQTFFHNFLKKN